MNLPMNKTDELLGINSANGRKITRRDFVGSTLIGAGSALLGGWTPAQLQAGSPLPGSADPWTGFGGVGDYANANGNTRTVMENAHLIRDGKMGSLLASAQPDPGEFDLVVIGGGFSGLGAAFQFQQKSGGKSCLVLDNHPIFGGEAKQNEFEVNGHRLFGPQGSNGFMPPTGRNTLSDDVWRVVGCPLDYEFADDVESFGLSIPHDSYDAMFWGEKNLDVGHLFSTADGQRWERNIWTDDLARVPWPSELKNDMLRAFTGNDTAHPPEGLGPWLDSMSYKTYLEEKLGLHPGVTAHLDPILAISDYGLSCDVISAYGAYLIQLPGMRGYFQADTVNFEAIKIMSYPGGNTTYARYIVKHLIPGAIPGNSFEEIAFGPVNFDSLDAPGAPVRIRQNATALDVRHDGDGVLVSYALDGAVRQVRAKTAVVATGGWVARNIVHDMPQSIRSSYGQFHHAPVLVVNVALNNWRFLQKLGISAARWYDGFGFFGSIRAPMKVGGQTPPFHPDQPMVMTFYVPFHTAGMEIKAQGALGRANLLGKSYLDYEREIRSHMNTVFADGGFDAARDIEGIILNRWGHAYIAPQPGFYFGGPDGKGLAAPIKQGHDRIFYGHSELGARMNYRNAIAEGGRAGEQAALRI